MLESNKSKELLGFMKSGYLDIREHLHFLSPPNQSVLFSYELCIKFADDLKAVPLS